MPLKLVVSLKMFLQTNEHFVSLWLLSSQNRRKKKKTNCCCCCFLCDFGYTRNGEEAFTVWWRGEGGGSFWMIFQNGIQNTKKVSFAPLWELESSLEMGRIYWMVGIITTFPLLCTLFSFCCCFSCAVDSILLVFVHTLSVAFFVVCVCVCICRSVRKRSNWGSCCVVLCCVCVSSSLFWD